VLKVVVVAAAAELLCLMGESVDGVMLLNGSGKETLAAIFKPKDSASRARSSAAVKAVSVTDLPDFKRFVKTQEGRRKRPLSSPLPRCRGCGLIGRYKKLHAKGEAAFVAEAGDKARVFWNQSRNSEAAKMKSAWFEAAKKRAAAGSAPGRPRRSACLLPLPLCILLALTVVL
jgi:hypothetical protein